MARTTKATLLALALCCAFSFDQPARAESQRSPALEAMEAEIEELKRRLEILTEEVRKSKEEETIPETAELKSEYGLAPSASKIYTHEPGLSIGGYGEFNLKKEVDDKSGNDDVFDFVRLVTYLGYKFNEQLLVNSEIEIEHASTGEDGEVALEFAYLDYLFNAKANFRAGLLLVPVGIVNEMHEPPFFHGNDRPAVETQIIPTTWRANGFGMFGEILPGLNYRTYGVTSMVADEFSSENLRGGRQDGSEEKAESFSWVGRLDYNPLAGLDISASAYIGNQGQDQTIVTARDPITGDPTATGSPSALMQMYEGHVQWFYRGWEFRALGVFVDLDDAGLLSVNAQETIGNQMLGYYFELAYDVMPLIREGTDQYLAPWFRYEKYDTQYGVPSGFTANGNDDRQAFEFGLDYKPIPRVVLKVDYRNEQADRGSRPDVVRVGAGFVF